MHKRLATVALCALSASPLTAQVYRPTKDAPVDPTMSSATAKFLSLPGFATDFVRSGGGQLVELGNGDAHYTCRVFSQSNLYAAFLVELTLSGRVAPNDPGYPPANAPNLGLFAGQYAPAGAVDPGAFVYYTQATGTLTGVRNLKGAVISLTAAAPVQLGVGANNNNDSDGLFASFQATVLSHPNWNTITLTAPPTLALQFVDAYAEDTTHPQVYDPNLTPLSEGRALRLPGVADDYVFVPAADFTEQTDGQATLVGSLARVDDLDDRWDLSLTLQARVDPGDPNHPPAGGPVLQLLPTAYTSGGGFLEPSSWHYYELASGAMVGRGINEGGQLQLVQSAPTQVGGGANNTNTYMGLYGAFAPTVVSQPTGRTLNVTGDVELFALTANFPVLPFPSLQVPAQTPQQLTVTDQGIVLDGDNLAWVSLFAVGTDLISPGDERDFADGWFRVLDNQRVEVHPAPGGAAGPRTLRAFNPAVQTGAVTADFLEPTTPVFCAEPSVSAQGSLNLRMHHGGAAGPALALIGISQTLAPSVYPGVVDLAIGGAFTDFVLDPTFYTHDTHGVAAFSYGPMSPALVGRTYHFQGMVVDLGQSIFPLPATNAWTVEIQ